MLLRSASRWVLLSVGLFLASLVFSSCPSASLLPACLSSSLMVEASTLGRCCPLLRPFFLGGTFPCSTQKSTTDGKKRAFLFDFVLFGLLHICKRLFFAAFFALCCCFVCWVVCYTASIKNALLWPLSSFLVFFSLVSLVLSKYFAIACINALTAFLLRVLLAARYKGKIKRRLSILYYYRKSPFGFA